MTLTKKNSMKLSEKFWPHVEHYLKTNKTILLPLGSTEQHGPTGLIGIDYLSAEKIAEAVAEKTNTLVAPVLPFGMAVHHMAFPGTMTLSPLVYVQVVTELLQSLTKHGFEKIVVINGHGGNIAPITTAFCQVKQLDETVDLKLFNWWVLSEVVAYEKIHFKEENGFHATCGEISVTQFTHPEAYKNLIHPDYPKSPDRPLWPMSPTQFRENFPDGRMGSNPALSSSAHGSRLFELAVTQIANEMSK